VAPPSNATRDLRQSRPAKRDVLTPDQHFSFKKNGFLVMPAFFSSEKVTCFQKKYNKIIRERFHDGQLSEVVMDWYIGTPEETRGYLKDAPEGAFTKPYKINDLYLDKAFVRDIILNIRLTDVVAELLDFIPVAMNTLSLSYGSQQRFHFDTFYMPPPSTNKMVAAWIALDDTNERNGPLCYYPGSHMIKPFQFDTGKLNENPKEMHKFDEYIATEIEKRGLIQEQFHAKKGDVFIWHSQLYHGGSPIIDNFETQRKSLVVHYFSALDFPHDGKRIRRHNNALYYVRPRLVV
jgi:phytanoyl-CoA hydroxylase